MSRLRWQEPNLARSPFLNERPVRRAALVLWLLFAGVAGLAVWQSLDSRKQAGTQLEELVRLNAETAAARERATTLDRELRSANLPAQNERAAFLNRRLAERSFSWGRLLETLSETLPRGVRLIRLSPESFTKERRQSGADRRSIATTHVALRVSGEAEETEPLLEWVDRLFQHPAFVRPLLARESEKRDTRIQFELSVAYLPQVANDLATAGATPASSAATNEVAEPVEVPQGTPTVVGRSVSDLPGAPSTASAVGSPTPGKPPAGAKAAAASPAPAAAPRTSAWGEGGQGAPANVEPSGGRTTLAPMAGGARPTSGATGSGYVPAFGAPSGSAAPPGAAAPGGRRAPGFPNNVMPTPLRPYASSTGADQ